MTHKIIHKPSNQWAFWGPLLVLGLLLLGLFGNMYVYITHDSSSKSSSKAVFTPATSIGDVLDVPPATLLDGGDDKREDVEDEVASLRDQLAVQKKSGVAAVASLRKQLADLKEAALKEIDDDDEGEDALASLEDDVTFLRAQLAKSQTVAADAIAGLKKGELKAASYFAKTGGVVGGGEKDDDDNDTETMASLEDEIAILHRKLAKSQKVAADAIAGQKKAELEAASSYENPKCLKKFTEKQCKAADKLKVDGLNKMFAELHNLPTYTHAEATKKNPRLAAALATEHEQTRREPSARQSQNRTENSEDSLPTFYTKPGDDGPRMLGLDECAAYRDAVPLEQRKPGIVGHFNTGTNLLSKLFGKNCKMGKAMQRSPLFFIWQVPWGKHNPANFRGMNDNGARFSMNKPDTLSITKHVNVTTVLPIHLIKDPLTWMQSTVAHPYTLRMLHTDTKDRSVKLPPTLYPVSKTKNFVGYVNEPKFERTTRDSESLAHLWNDWNRAHMDVSYPTLVVRYEDLLFETERVVRAICGCVGGKQVGTSFAHLEEDSKPWQKKEGQKEGYACTC